MIITLTLNPSLDRTVDGAAPGPGLGHPGVRGHVDPGGKGRQRGPGAARQRCAARAVLPFGGEEGQQLVGCCRPRAWTICGRGRRRRPGRTSRWPSPTAPSPRSTRPGGAAQRLPRGRRGSADAVRLAQQRPTATGSWSAAACRRGPRRTLYARLCHRLLAAGVRVAVDTGCRTGRGAVAARPALVKPNGDGTGRAVGRRIDSLERRRRRRAASWVPGGRRACWPASAPTARCWSTTTASSSGAAGGRPRSAVGAGDCLLAGFLAAGAEAQDALAEAVRGARRPSAFLAAGCRRRTRSPAPRVRDAPGVDPDQVVLVAPDSAHRPARSGTGPPRQRNGDSPWSTPYTPRSRGPVSRPPCSESAATWPRWSCPTSARSSPGA